jgi:hypothetical protein
VIRKLNKIEKPIKIHIGCIHRVDAPWPIHKYQIWFGLDWVDPMDWIGLDFTIKFPIQGTTHDWQPVQQYTTTYQSTTTTYHYMVYAQWRTLNFFLQNFLFWLMETPCLSNEKKKPSAKTKAKTSRNITKFWV